MFEKDPDFDDSSCYSAWRKWESYQIPMTEDGIKKAEARWYAFKAGWLAGQSEKKEGWHLEWVPDSENPWRNDED